MLLPDLLGLEPRHLLTADELASQLFGIPGLAPRGKEFLERLAGKKAALLKAFDELLKGRGHPN